MLTVSNFHQNDTDQNLIGDACDDKSDADQDGISDSIDNCKDSPNGDQVRYETHCESFICIFYFWKSTQLIYFSVI